jgi:integrase
VARRRRRGTGTWYQRADGLYVAQVSRGADRAGKRHRSSFSSRSKAEIDRWLREANRAVRAGEDPDELEPRIRVADHFADWLEAIGPTVRPTTARGYEILVRLWIEPAIGQLPLVRLTAPDVRRMLERIRKAGRSPRTAHAALTVLRMGLEAAVRDGLIDRNVADGIRQPRSARKPVAATSPEEARAIMAAFDGHRLEALVTTALGTGLRLGELLGLRHADVAGELVRITGAIRPQPRHDGKGWILERVETKTRGSVRTLHPPAFVRTAIAEQRRRQLRDGPSSDYVFPSEAGTPQDPRNVTKAFQRQLRATGLPPMRFHDLRHAAATVMLGAGVPLRVIQETLGHTSIATTAAIYAHVLPSLQRDAAERLDEALRAR